MKREDRNIIFRQEATGDRWTIFLGCAGGMVPYGFIQKRDDDAYIPVIPDPKKPTGWNDEVCEDISEAQAWVKETLNGK